MGTYIHWVLLFAWVLLFKKWIATGLMVLIFIGYLYLMGTYTPEFMVSESWRRAWLRISIRVKVRASVGDCRPHPLPGVSYPT